MNKEYKRFSIMAANNRHFDSLVKDFSRSFRTVTRGKRIAEFEDDNNFIVITIYPEYIELV